MTRLPPFELHAARSIAEATELLDAHREEAVVYSGGTELLLLMKLGFAAYGHLIDVKPIAELRALEVRNGSLWIGGAVTHRTIERSPLVRDGWPDLVAMERGVANVRVRTTGSLGGNLAFADPHSDPSTFLLASGARVHLARGESERSLGIDELVRGPYATALEPGELLRAIEVPAPQPASATAHLRFAFHERPAATVSAYVRLADEAVAEARVAVGSVGVTPALVDASDALRGSRAGALDPDALASIAEAAAIAAAPVSDQNGSDEYKHALVRTLVRRAIEAAAGLAAARTEAPA